MRKKNKPEGNLLLIRGKLVPGYGVASGPSRDYPYGALAKQKPYFKQCGLDLDHYYEGTLNISIAPHHFKWIKPKFNFQAVAWTDLHPPEDFSFHPCRVRAAGETYDGILYYPHPETKIRHFEDDTLLEVITTWIPGIHHGDLLEIEVEKGALLIIKKGNKKKRTISPNGCFKVKWTPPCD